MLTTSHSAGATLLAVIAIGAASACGAPTPAESPQQAAARQQQTVETALRGEWRLVEFHPDSPLEPMLQAWLDQQRNTLTLRFENGRLVARSPTLTYGQPFTISEAYGSRFTFTSPGNSGVPYTSTCEITPDGQKILFRSQTDPLRGNGLIQRTQR